MTDTPTLAADDRVPARAHLAAAAWSHPDGERDGTVGRVDWPGAGAEEGGGGLGENGEEAWITGGDWVRGNRAKIGSRVSPERWFCLAAG